MDNRRRLTLAGCCAAHGVQDGLGATIYVLLPILAQAFGLGYAQVGIIRAANNSAMALFEIPSGVLAERWGERALLVFGLLCAGFGYLSVAAASGFVPILLALFAAGLGAAFQHALSSSVVSKTFHDAGVRTALGAYNSSGDVGKLGFTATLSLMIGAGLAWQGVVVAFGLVALLTAVGLWYVFRAVDVGGPPAHAAEPGAVAGRTDWGIRCRGAFTALAIIVFLDISVQGGFLTFLAFLMLAKEVPTGLATFAVVLTLAGGIFGKLGCGWLAERIGVIRSLIIVQCLTAAGIAAVLAAAPLVAFFMLPLVGLVLQGSSSITYATVSDLVRRERQSRAFAAIYTTASASAIVAPVTFGIIGDRLGLTPAMLTMAGVVLLTIPLSALLRPALTKRIA
ncbi:MAG: MFS transporter [Gammaproteobacteria bacterium]|nr:MFS transporter [Gammaproteobacteria bacterium]